MAGLKIDFLALNTKNGFEVAFAACEVSKDTMKSKLFHDNSKFYLNTLDFMHILTGQKLHLARNGSYVSVPQSEFNFPKSVSELEDFLDIYACISEFVVTSIDIERIYLLIEMEQDSVTIDSQNIISVVISVHSDSDIELVAATEEQEAVEADMFRRKRHTWYTPPSEERSYSVISPSLFGHKRFRCDNNSSLIIPLTSNSDQVKPFT
ncbi:hypothetical protein BY458DRAFT_557429 [Sporodiniella umbellata]|nr:hypothetical protein BY458DRAFT_557429 [Sporodiniella umbellata]